ncbi:hypothetical protein GEMRC1_005185 [Eukaryota sp. GEM-RC1]
MTASYCHNCSCIILDNTTIGCCDLQFCSQSCHDTWMEEVIVCPRCDELLDWSLLSEADEETRSAFVTEIPDLPTTSPLPIVQTSLDHTSSDYCDVFEDLEMFQLRRRNELIDKSNISGYAPPKLPYSLIKEVMLFCLSSVFNKLFSETPNVQLSQFPTLLHEVSHLGRVSKRFLNIFQQVVEIFCRERTFLVTSTSSTDVPIFTKLLHLRQHPQCPLLTLPFNHLFLSMFFDASLVSVSSFPSHLLDRITLLTLPSYAHFGFLLPYDPYFCRNLHHLTISGAQMVTDEAVTEYVQLDLSKLKLDQCPRLTCFTLCYISIDDYSIFDQESSLTELSFIKCNFCGDPSLLTRHLATNSILKTLCIERCRLSDTERMSLIEGLSLNTSITALVWDCLVDVDDVILRGPVHPSSFFKRSLLFSKLSLTLDVTTIQQIIPVFQSAVGSSIFLKSINLKFLGTFSTQIFYTFLAWLVSQQSLERFKLQLFKFSYVNSNFPDNLLLLPKPHQIQSINLKYLKLQGLKSRDGSHFLWASIIANCLLLQELDLSHNVFEYSLGDRVVSSAMLCTSLYKLNLSGCGLKDAEVEVLANLLLHSDSLQFLNLKHNSYSLLGHMVIADVCNQRKYLQVLSSYPKDVIVLDEYQVVDRHVVALNRLLDLCSITGDCQSEIRFEQCMFFDLQSFKSFIRVLKSHKLTNTVVFANSSFDFLVFLSLYDEMKHLGHINFTLDPYHIDVNNGILGFAGRLGNGFRSEILASRSIKMFDCSRARFRSAASDLKFSWDLLKASVCSFSTPRVKWVGHNLELDLSDSDIEYLKYFESFTCLKKLNLTRIKGFDCHVLDSFPFWKISIFLIHHMF